MKDADQAIQRVLISLRNAKPAAGMEQRLVFTLNEAAEARDATHAGLPSTVWPRQAFAMLMVGVAVLAVGLVVIVTGRIHRQTLTNVSSQSVPADAPQMAGSLEASHKPPATEPHVVSAVPIPMVRARIRARSHPAFADGLHASSSYPAPPLPLTQQERLLLRLARRRDPASLTLLNPEVRAAQTARATEQFQRFFEINDQEMRTQLE